MCFGSCERWEWIRRCEEEYASIGSKLEVISPTDVYIFEDDFWRMQEKRDRLGDKIWWLRRACLDCPYDSGKCG